MPSGWYDENDDGEDDGGGSWPPSDAPDTTRRRHAGRARTFGDASGPGPAPSTRAEQDVCPAAAAVGVSLMRPDGRPSATRPWVPRRASVGRYRSFDEGDSMSFVARDTPQPHPARSRQLPVELRQFACPRPPNAPSQRPRLTLPRPTADDDDDGGDGASTVAGAPAPVANPDASAGDAYQDAQAAIATDMLNVPFGVRMQISEEYIDDPRECLWCTRIDAVTARHPVVKAFVDGVRAMAPETVWDHFIHKVYRLVEEFRNWGLWQHRWSMESIAFHFKRHMPATLHLLHAHRGLLQHMLHDVATIASRRAVTPNSRLDRSASTHISPGTVLSMAKMSQELNKSIGHTNAQIKQFRESGQESIVVPGDRELTATVAGTE